MAKVRGKVVDVRGKYGFIEADGDRVFFHQRNVIGSTMPSKGQDVLFNKEEIPEAERRGRPENKWRATDVELIGDSKAAKTKSFVEPQNEEKDGVILSPNCDYVFRISNFTGSLTVSSEASLEYFDKQSGARLLEFTRSGTLVISEQGLFLLVKMRAIESKITFAVPGSKPVTYTLQFKP